MKAKEYVAKYREWLVNPPEVFEGKPSDVPIEPKFAALVKVLQEITREAINMLNKRCGENPSNSALKALIREAENKFDKVRIAIADDDIKETAFLGFLSKAHPKIYEIYSKP